MIARLAALAAALALAACASAPRVEVAVRHDLSAAPTQAWTAIEAAGDLDAGSLRFRALAQTAAEKLAAAGFPPAPDAAPPAVIARLSYARPLPRFGVRPTMRYQPFFGPRYAIATDAFGRPRVVTLFRQRPWRRETVAYTVYDHRLTLTLDRRSDGVRIWEGEATVVSSAAAPDSALDAALAGLFVDFPGENASVKLVTVETAAEDAAGEEGTNAE